MLRGRLVSHISCIYCVVFIHCHFQVTPFKMPGKKGAFWEGGGGGGGDVKEREGRGGSGKGRCVLMHKNHTRVLELQDIRYYLSTS